MALQRLSTAQIAELLAIASSRRKATESERIEAIKSLLSEYRLQIAEYRNDEREVVDPLLMQGVGDWGRQIFSQENAIIALERFLGTRRSPGKRAKNSARDLSIATAVVREMEGGATLEEAAASVASDYKLAEDTIKKIYVRTHKEVKADLAMTALELAWSRPPS